MADGEISPLVGESRASTPQDFLQNSSSYQHLPQVEAGSRVSQKYDGSCSPETKEFISSRMLEEWPTDPQPLSRTSLCQSSLASAVDICLIVFPILFIGMSFLPASCGVIDNILALAIAAVILDKQPIAGNRFGVNVEEASKIVCSRGYHHSLAEPTVSNER